MYMTLQQFLQLDKAGQEEIVQKEGVKLAERIQPDFKYELYQLTNFYVELKIEQSAEVAVSGLQTFESLDELEPYFQIMNIKT
jgi:gamma-glutamylcyclotransferase (GGCT)/AIG2-like uncharacterized protein YtfP